MHGGDIYRNKIELDFSVNVNPLGVPDPVRQAMVKSLTEVECYPDMECAALKKALAEHFGLGETGQEIHVNDILCGNGASELITAICRWKMPKTAMVTGPGFAGYRKALEAVNCEIQVHLLQEERNFVPGEDLMEAVEQRKPEILFLANPSNPTGVLLDRKYLQRLLTVCLQTGTVVVLDECFMELTGQAEECSMCRKETLQKFENLMILRAFTKSFAIPGIRLGYLVCKNQEFVGKIAAQLPEWNVSIPAQAAGVAAMQCIETLAESAAYIEKERLWLTAELERLGAKVFPSQANYLLFHWKSEDLYECLLQKGILIRDCSDYEGLEKGYYRIAVRTREENEILLQSLRQI